MKKLFGTCNCNMIVSSFKQVFVRFSIKGTDCNQCDTIRINADGTTCTICGTHNDYFQQVVLAATATDCKLIYFG